eukprot:356023-Chlamydomonas_euryale.AAC.1
MTLDVVNRTDAWHSPARRRGKPAKTILYRVRRLSPSLRGAGDQRPHQPAAAAPCQRPQCLPATGKAACRTAPSTCQLRYARRRRSESELQRVDQVGYAQRWGSLAYANPQRSAAHSPRTRGQDA